MDNSKRVEQVIELKDGRVIYKTDNGFTSWVKTAKGESSKVSHGYYLNAKKHRI